MSQSGRIISVNVSEKTGMQKEPVASGELVKEHGIRNDSHAGPYHRQISLLAQESINKMKAKGADVVPGSFAENLTTEGIDLPSLPVGTIIRTSGGATLEVTQIGKVCHNDCAVFAAIGDCVMPREGIFVKVLEGGTISPGDTITVAEGGPNDDRA
ncbi:MAG: MOSC domain-containing protein [Deltaproteobacteria bacterium]|nr:MOSC domain-containing protein [Candidatus Zymogenaceae bacterium]